MSTSLSPRLLNMIDSLEQVSDKDSRVLGGREMSQASHRLMLTAGDLVTYKGGVGVLAIADRSSRWVFHL